MDVVYVKGLTVRAIIGAYEWERQVRQLLVFNVEMPSDVRKAAATDNLKDALNYASACEVVKEVAEKGEFQLIETAAERAAERLMKEFGLAWVRLEVSKPRPYSGGHSVGVSIERGNRGPE
jgi:7,8-dihydroneopterin aldolase/epimerase/oxygenase